MTWLAFIVEMVKALAWPATTVIIVLILRRPLVALLPLLTRFKWKAFEFEFGKQVAEAQAEAAEKLPPETKRVAASSSLQALVAASPRAAVLEAWIQVDRAARGAIIRHDIAQPVQPYVPTTKIVNTLQSENLIAPDQAGLIHDLRALRNQAAHAPDFALTNDAAQNYVDLANRLVDYLDSV